jgi:prepilin-type N-terminal cleavage/methylation domain-containing protein
MKFNQKGFTIIELIVVIAIIAVLAAIVLVNVTQYINKGRNAAIKGNLSSLMTTAADYFNTNGSYASLSETNVKNAITAIPVTTSDAAMWQFNIRSNTTHDGFCACAMEVPTGTTGTIFCVDSTGAKVETAATTCSAHCTAGSAATDGICK